MTVLAVIAALAFGGAHLVGAVAMRSSERIPSAAKAAWAVASAAVVVGAVALAIGADVGAVAAIAGVVAVVALAVANGYWIHGTPTWSHHLVRGVLGAATIALLVSAI